MKDDNQLGKTTSSTKYRQINDLLSERAAQPLKHLDAQYSEEIWQALFELNIHRLELEIQNEELRQMQEKLSISKARYFDLYNLAPVGYCTINEQGIIKEVNFTGINLLGITRETSVNQSITHFVSKDDQDKFDRFCKGLFKSRVRQTCELRMVKKNGTEFWARLEATPSHTFPSGVRPGVEDFSSARIVLMDITELKLVQAREQELRVFATAAQTAMDILESMGEAVLLLDTTGRVLSVNPALEEMTGIFSSQMIGQSAHSFFSSILQQEEYKTFEPVLADALRGQASFIPPITLTERNNSHVIVIPAISYITGDDDTKPTGIIITLKDISAFRESQDLLKKNELKYRELVENANSIIIRVSPNYKITFFNEYAQKFFGYTEAEVLGKNVVGIIVPETDSDGHDLQEMVRDIMSIPEDHESIENENVCKNGTRVWVHWANRAVRDREGNLVEVLSVGTDITEKKKTQQAIQTYEAELRSLSSELTLSEERARRQLAGALHDTVGQTLALTKLKLGSLGRLVKGKEAKRRLTEIREMFEGSIHQIRTMSFELSSPILYELGLGDAIEWLGETLGKRYAFTVCFQGPEKPCTVTEAVKIFFFQVARELLINIAKHAEATKVNLSLVEANGWLIMQIVDDGKGINPEDCKGGLSKKNRFGLFSIRERTKHMGGTFEIQSEEKGTIAIVSAPIERAKVISG